MKALEGPNLLLRFVLELSALAAVAYWGYTSVDGVGGWFVAAAGIAAFALVWGLFLAPKRRIDLSKPVRLAIEFTVFGLAAAALAAAGRTALAIVFAAVVVVSGTLNYLWSE